jgi:capsular polysaccharide biosynthesis protein
MELDLNVQYYLDVVLRQWKVVLVVFLAATLAAALVSIIQEPTYEATVVLTEQSYEYWDVPRLSSLDKTVVKLYPTQAHTSAVESRVIDAIGPNLSASEKTPGALMSAVSVHEDNDNPAIFRIKAQAHTPQKAALVANTWAEQYIEEAPSFQISWSSQLEAVKKSLDSAEEALTAFRQDTGVGMVEEPEVGQTFALLGPSGVELEKKAEQLAEHRQARDNLNLLLQSAQLAHDTGGSIEDLPLELLDSPVIAARGQLSAQRLRDEGSLDGVIRLLQNEEEVVSGAIGQLEANVETLQQSLAQDQVELERLVRERDMAESAYKAVEYEIDEAALFQSNTQILSRAAGATLLGPNTKLNVILGAALGLAAGVAAAFAAQYVVEVRSKH